MSVAAGALISRGRAPGRSQLSGSGTARGAGAGSLFEGQPRPAAVGELIPAAILASLVDE